MKTRKHDSEGERGSEIYKAICSECGQECEVLFEPNEVEPVCRACFLLKHKVS